MMTNNKIIKAFIESIVDESPVIDNDVIDRNTFSDMNICNIKKDSVFQHSEKINNDLEAFIYDVSRFKYYSIIIKKGNECVGTIELDYRTNDAFPFPRMLTIVLKRMYRGKGYSKVLYSWLIKKFGGIFSDESLSGGTDDARGAFEMWQWVANNFDTYFLDGKKGLMVPLNQGISLRMMKSRSDRFLATLEPFDYEGYNERESNNNPEEIPNDSLVSANESPEMMSYTHPGATMLEEDPNTWNWDDGEVISTKDLGNGAEFIKTRSRIHKEDLKYGIKDINTKKMICGMKAHCDFTGISYVVFPKEVQEQLVATTPEFRGKGWGKTLYKNILEIDKLLVSDHIHYPGAAKIWKDYLPTIAYVYNSNEDGKLSPFDFKKGSTAFHYFVASKKKLI